MADESGRDTSLRAIDRRTFLGTAVAGALAAGTAPLVLSDSTAYAAAPKPVKVGMTFPFSGVNAADSINISNGAVLAIDEYNRMAGTRYPQIIVEKRDDETPSAADFDPAQAAINIRSLVADPSVVANIGPLISSEGKIIAPLLSRADLATVTGSSTNYDITDPKFARIYRPGGKTIYFRTCATSNVILPALAHYAVKNLKISSIFIVDDKSATGVVQATDFQTAAAGLGIKIVGRDSIDPQQADYSVLITKIKGVAPQAVFTAGILTALSKFAPQAHAQIPNTVFLSNDGILTPQFIKLAGAAAAKNWYSVSGAPNIDALPAAKAFIKTYKARFGQPPEAYAGPTYDAGLAVAEAIKRVVNAGKQLDRHSVRAVLETINIPNGVTGPIAFKPSGDRKTAAISIWRAGSTDFVFVASAATQ